MDDINELFEFCSIIGHGSYGQVHKVIKKSDNKAYALKKIHIKDPDQINLKNKEILTLSLISSDFVIKYYDSWIIRSDLYILTELCSYSLKDLIQKIHLTFRCNRNVNHLMTTSEYFILSHIFKDILECVQYLHGCNPPIIHRDLKPANILINENSKNGKFIKLCDFGLAKITSNETQTHTENIGTPKYMAPEVFSGIDGKSRYSIKSDIYSLGRISLDLFGSSDNLIFKNIELKPKWKSFQETIEKMLSINYKERPTCASVVSFAHNWILDYHEIKPDNSFDIQDKSGFILNYIQEKIGKTNVKTDQQTNAELISSHSICNQPIVIHTQINMLNFERKKKIKKLNLVNKSTNRMLKVTRSEEFPYCSRVNCKRCIMGTIILISSFFLGFYLYLIIFK